jgi:hypothetical protein
VEIIVNTAKNLSLTNTSNFTFQSRVCNLDVPTQDVPFSCQLNLTPWSRFPLRKLSHGAGQENLRHFCDPKIHHRIYKSTPLGPI